MKKLWLHIITKTEYQIAVFLSLFFIFEAITNLSYNLGANFHNYSAIVKGVFMICAIIYSLYNLTNYRKKILLFLFSLMIIFFIGQYQFNNGFGNNIFKNIIFLSRYSFIFTLILVLKFPFKKNYDISFKTYEIIVLTNSFLILVGVLFDFDIFRTYNASRFGYNGLFMVPSITTYFYALALTYYTNIYIKTGKKLFELLFISLICFLLGTKAIILFFILTLIHVFWIKKWYKKSSFLIVSVLSFTLLIFNYKVCIDFLKIKFKVLNKVYQEYDLITMLTSYRNLRLKENFLPLINEKWHFTNYLFGGTDFKKFRVEFELFDVFLFFGIIGSGIYLWFYFKNIIKFSQLVPFAKIQLVSLLFVALLSGTFFNNASLALYLLVVLSSLNSKQRSWV